MVSSEGTIDGLDANTRTLALSATEEALSLALAAFAEAQDAGDAAGMAEARFDRGRCELRLARLAQAEESFQKALDAFSAIGDDQGVMESLNALGAVLMEMGRYERALDFFSRSLEEAREQGDRLCEAKTLSDIGEVCLEFGEIKEAFDYFLRAYETVPDEVEGELIANILLNVGKAYQCMGNWSLAKDFGEKALSLAMEGGNLQTSSRCWHLLGLISFADGVPELAAAQYRKALGLCESLGNERGRASVLLDLGAIHALNEEMDQALDRFNIALASAESRGAKRLVHTACQRLSGVYETMGDFRRALGFHKLFSLSERESLSEDAGRKIKNMTVRYEVEKSGREAEIYRLKNIELKEKTDELENANRQILAIAETGRLIAASLDLDTIINTLYDTLRRNIPFDLFGLALYDEGEKSLDYRAYIFRGERLQRSRVSPDQRRSYAAICLRDKAPVFVPDAHIPPEGLDDGHREDGPHRSSRPSSRASTKPSGSLMFLPLVIDDRPIGMLTIQCDGRNTLTPRHLTLVEALAPYVAVAVENSLIHDSLEAMNNAIRGEKEELEKATAGIRHLANHDPLTGLPNRRLLFELLQKTFDIARRNGTRVGVIFIDLDDFKPINDNLGHLAGDRALVAVAERLRAMLRASDTVARVGGDEFVAVLTMVKDGKDIELAARKILEECGYPIIVEGTPCRVGFSMGIALFPDDGDSIEAIVNAADAAMYRVKRGRKNGYAFARDGEPGPQPGTEPLAGSR